VTNFIDYFLGGISSGAIIALMALALVLVWRSTRVVNFAQIGQATFTTYIALTVRDATGNWLLALVVAMVVGFIFGIFVHFLVIRAVKRLDTSGAIIATFGVLIAIEAFVAMVWGGESKSFPPPISNSGYEAFGRVWPFAVRPTRLGVRGHFGPGVNDHLDPFVPRTRNARIRLQP